MTSTKKDFTLKSGDILFDKVLLGDWHNLKQGGSYYLILKEWKMGKNYIIDCIVLDLKSLEIKNIQEWILKKFFVKVV